MARQCSSDKCTNPVFGGSYCRMHQHKRTDKKKPVIKPVRNAVRIKPYSAKRQKTNLVYNQLAKQFKIDNRYCKARLEGCTTLTQHVHHKKGRIGALLTDLKHFLAVCGSCHRKIELEPKMALELGLSESRFSK